MTSTITAEDRAEVAFLNVTGLPRATVQEMFASNRPVMGRLLMYEDFVSIIAVAIRDAERCAEDRAYERAADKCVWFADKQTPPGTSYCEGRADGASACAAHILNLKSPSPPKDQGHE